MVHASREVDTAAHREFLVFKDTSIRVGKEIVLKDLNWTWKRGEVWAILGPGGPARSAFIDAILGKAVLERGALHGPTLKAGRRSSWAPNIACVSPQIQRELACHEGSFYQLRWHSGLEQGPRTVSQFLSQESVEDRNPYEVGVSRGNRRGFARFQNRVAGWLGIKVLWSRRLIHLSNGELRKTLLVHALLKRPDLLLLEDPYGGLDGETRAKLKKVIADQILKGWQSLVVTHRVEEIPAPVTHLLVFANDRVLSAGRKKEMLQLWYGLNRRKRPPSPRAARVGSRRSNPRPVIHGVPLVEFEHVTLRGAGRCILNDISWTIREGECWGVVGPNGAGKTALLSMIQGDHPQVYGQRIRLFGRTTESTRAVWLARQRIGWMSPELHQHYPADWTAEEVVCSGLFNSIGLYEPCSRRQFNRARQWLADLGMKDGSRSKFGELPFAEQRLALLARAAIKKPRLLILDEPCQGLDSEQRDRLLDVVDHSVALTGASLLFVTHHKGEVPRCMTHVLRLAGGRVREKRKLRGSP